MEKINIAEILKNSPKGTMLYSLVHGYVELIGIYRDIIRCKPKHLNTIISFYFDGKFIENTGECILFPSKENRNWYTFHRPFKDGDIVFYNDTIAIFKEWGDETLFKTYVTKYLCCDSLIDINVPLFGKSVRKEIRFATEEEKQKLFDAIKANGYKWNAETKTLEKLPKFNDGDIIFEDRFHSICIFKKEGTIKGTVDYYCGISLDDFFVKDEKDIDEHFGDISDYRLATKEERQKLFDAIKANGHKWNDETKTLDKLIEPKFKVGDRITNGKYSFTITHIVADCYHSTQNGVVNVLSIEKQDEWKLEKFDITTLKGFDKVLVRYGNLSKWSTGIFSHTEKSDNKLYFIVNTKYWEQCIPYKGNEHLRGTTDACSDYFKTWE